MRKFGLLAAVAGLAIGGSVARADFVITSTRTQNITTIGGQAVDRISFTVTNDGLNTTGTGTNNIDVALFDSTGGGKNGMVISASNTADGSDANAGALFSVPSLVGYPDIFHKNSEFSLVNSSWIRNINGQASKAIGGSSIVTFPGGVFTLDQADGTGAFHNTYADQQLVGGFGGDEFWTASAPVISAGAIFVQATVLHGDSVTLATTVANGRTTPSTSWETGGTAFGVVNSSTIRPNATGTYTDAIPEPASIGFLGLAAGGLLARRRRHS